MFHQKGDQPSVDRSGRVSYISIAILLGAALFYLGNTYRHHLMQWDDAYIAFRFAQHVADGHGLIWNIGGEPVEGSTSLLHVLLLALGIKLGASPTVAALAISVISVLVTSAMLVMIVHRQFGFVYPAAAAVLGLYLIDEPTAIHSTSGLETPLFVAVLCSGYFAALLFVDSPRWWIAVSMASAVFLSVLCRPEAVLYGAVLYAVLVSYYLRVALQGKNGSKGLWRLTLAAGLVVLFGLLYALWKYGYFGYLLPNPYYVKSGQISLAGLHEVSRFFKHMAWPFAPLTLGFVFLTGGKRLMSSLRNAPRIQTKVLLTVGPPLLALVYYTTIIHEVGGAYRFSYPTYFYSVFAVAALCSLAMSSIQSAKRRWRKAAAVTLACFAVMMSYQSGWRLSPLPLDEFNQIKAQHGGRGRIHETELAVHDHDQHS